MGDIRFIHAADLHLGSPFIGMKGLQKKQWQAVKDSTFDAFDRLIDYAVKEQPDFLLIVGDIYDGEDRSLRAQHRFQLGMQRLYEAAIPVVISYGNHDHLSGKWTRFELPDNVFCFGEAVSQIRLDTKNGSVAITGFSYGKRHVKEPLVADYPPADDGEQFHIGMLHGSMDGDTSHAVYAPFKKEQLLGKNYDYWALGHIHKRQEIHSNPSIVYSGNLQGRHRGEAGPKGFYDVTLSKQETLLRFVPASVIQFDVVPVDCSGILHMNELLESCQEELRKWVEQSGSLIAEIRFVNIDADTGELFEDVSVDELLETIREAAGMVDGFAWVDRLAFEESAEQAELSLLGENVIGAMESWELKDWKDVLKELYRHPKGSRYLEALGNSAITEIAETAVQKIRRGMQAKE